MKYKVKMRYITQLIMKEIVKECQIEFTIKLEKKKEVQY